jgi:hypothetical protein
MATTGIHISLKDTSIGSIQADESISCLVVDMAGAEANLPDDMVLNTPYMITSVSAAEGLGITSEWANGNGAKTMLYQHINEFYGAAAVGTKLWLILVQTTADNNFSTANFYTALQPIVFKTISGSYKNRPRAIGFCQSKGTLPAPAYEEDGVNNKTDQEALNQIQTFLTNMFELGIRMVGVFDGAYIKQGTFSSATEIAKLMDCAAMSYPNVAYCVTGSSPNGLSSVGRVLGVRASRNIAASIGNVSLGSVATEEYFTDSDLSSVSSNPKTGTPVNGYDVTLANLIAPLGYIFTRNRLGVEGLYYNDGATCNATTMALNKIERVAVGNSVCDDAQMFLTYYINQNIPCDSSGQILQAFKNSAIAEFTSQYINPRVNAGQASAIDFDFKAKDDNYIQSEALEVTIRIVPNPAMREAFVTTFFVTSIS